MRSALSIIIPCLNEAAGITATLERLQALRARGHEVVVVDGGSDDSTLTLAQPGADQVIVAQRGRAAQMNAGAQIARGDVVLFLHADCGLPLGADQTIIETLRTSGKRWGCFNVRLDTGNILLRLVARMMNLRSRWTGVATGDQGIFVERELFQSLGGFPEIALMEDIALSKKLRSVCRPLCIHERIVVSARRWQRNGVVRTIALMWRLRVAYFFGGDPRKLGAAYAATRTQS